MLILLTNYRIRSIINIIKKQKGYIMQKIQVTVYFSQEDHMAFKAACKKNDVTMASKLLDQAKSYTK